MNVASPAVSVDSQSELWTAAQSAAADTHTMNVVGLPSAVLMERAALAVTAEVERFLPAGGTTTTVEVLCGPGNNGGDGFAVARLLAGRGYEVAATLCADRGGAATVEQLRWARASGVVIREFADLVTRAITPAMIVVDALLGTGSRGAPRGKIGEAIARVAGRSLGVVAVDIPSGIDPDTGAAPGTAVTANSTVTFQRSKPGLHIVPGRAHAGRVTVAEIGLVAPPRGGSVMHLVTPASLRAESKRPADPRHKGDRGHVGVIGGTGGTPGAAVLAGLSALRAGAGVVTWLVADDIEPARATIANRPELMVADLETGLRSSDLRALVVGPGLTASAHPDVFHELFAADPRPAVWDAGALVWVPIGRSPNGVRLLTPHPGEAARLMSRVTGKSWTAVGVQRQRLDVCRTLAEATESIVLLKGAGTVMVDPNGRVAILPIGSASLATAGSGDCLAGALAAVLATEEDPWTAACRGAFAHGLAGELAARRFPAVVASEIADALGPAMLALQRGLPPGINLGTPRVYRG